MTDGNNTTDAANSSIKFITPEELADWLKVPLSWIYDRTRKSGPERLPFKKFGKYVRFRVSDVEEYIRQKGINREELDDGPLPK